MKNACYCPAIEVDPGNWNPTEISLQAETGRVTGVLGWYVDQIIIPGSQERHQHQDEQKKTPGFEKNPKLLLMICHVYTDSWDEINQTDGLDGFIISLFPRIYWRPEEISW